MLLSLAHRRAAGSLFPRIPSRSHWFAGLLCALLLFAFRAQIAQAQTTTTRFDGSTSLNNVAVAMAHDTTGGNTYVTGYTRGGSTGDDIYTVKYDNTGAVVWTATYNGPRNGEDHPAAIAIDTYGSVYVTGYSVNNFSANSGNDYITIKYNSNGVQQWATPYNGTGNNSDQATAIGLDGGGNVFVTGGSFSSGNGTDYATIKYNSSGAQQGIQIYTSAGINTDQATALAIDSAGNVYVTGYAKNVVTAASDNDYVTIKYDNALSAAVWTAPYSSAGSGSDQPAALAVDSAGNVYVTGHAANVVGSSGNDYLTVKYNSNGVQQWATPYNGTANGNDQANAIALDTDGNVYVTGSAYTANVIGGNTSNSMDYATVKYNSGGVQQWATTYDGPGDGSDAAYALALDSNGNVYVTGSAYISNTTGNDFATVKYDNGGAFQWVKTYSGPGNHTDTAVAIAVDGNGNVYVSGTVDDTDTGTLSDYATRKYDSNGNVVWTAVTDAAGSSSDTAVAIKADSSGNFYVTGYNAGKFYTIKYAHNGAMLWSASYPAVGQTTGLALDGSGNVYITGYAANAVGSNTGNDYVTIKYDANGVQQWARFYNSTANLSDMAVAIAADSAGNVYVTGTSDNGNSADYLTVKYDTTGAQKWTARYNGGSTDTAAALAVDGSGNVYVTGSSFNGAASFDFATVKYDSNGTQQWVAFYDGGNGIDQAYALAVDGSGNVIVAGRVSGSTTGYDFAVVKYDNTGAFQWARTYAGSGSSSDQANAVTVDSAGNIYATGYAANVAGSNTGNDYVTIKYDSSGTRQWIATYNGAGNGDDEAKAIALDSSGNVYVTGYVTNNSTGIDFATIKYNNAGVQQQLLTYNGTGNGGDQAVSLAVDANGSVYVAGTSLGATTGNDIVSLVYDNNPVPTLSSLTPATANAGGGAVTLTLTGSNFLSNSQVLWNGATNLSTIYVSPTKLQAVVPSTLTASATSANISVFNPALGGGTSGSLTFTVVGAPRLVVSMTSVQRVNGQVQVNYTVTNNGTATANNVTVTKLRLSGSTSYMVQAAPGAVLQGPTTLTVGASLSGTVTFPSSVASGSYAFQVYGAYNTSSYTLSTPITVP